MGDSAVRKRCAPLHVRVLEVDHPKLPPLKWCTTGRDALLDVPHHFAARIDELNAAIVEFLQKMCGDNQGMQTKKKKGRTAIWMALCSVLLAQPAPGGGGARMPWDSASAMSLAVVSFSLVSEKGSTVWTVGCGGGGREVGTAGGGVEEVFFGDFIGPGRSWT
jgi:hypothetical protein